MRHSAETHVKAVTSDQRLASDAIAALLRANPATRQMETEVRITEEDARADTELVFGDCSGGSEFGVEVICLKARIQSRWSRGRLRTGDKRAAQDAIATMMIGKEIKSGAE
jgi:hypothetical protein